MKWQDAPAFKVVGSPYIQHKFDKYDVVWDQSTDTQVQFLIIDHRDNGLVYIEYDPQSVKYKTDEQCNILLLFATSLFEDMDDFKAFLETKKQHKSRK